jgi:hypothetical protein
MSKNHSANFFSKDGTTDISKLWYESVAELAILFVDQIQTIWTNFLEAHHNAAQNKLFKENEAFIYI